MRTDRLRRTLALLGLTALLLCSTPIRSEGGTAVPGIARPEYPRPDWQREAWLNLNGTWDLRYDPENAGVGAGWFAAHAAGFDQQITVPFPWQSSLSGQKNTHYRGVAWYRRRFTPPTAWRGQRLFLRFGAANYLASVWVNGTLLGEHEGGYDPFEFDITDQVQAGENTVVVRVDYPADLREIPHGKQQSEPRDPWWDVDFTGSGGIWQTVWLEARPAAYLLQAQITPDVDAAAAHFHVTAHAPAGATLAVQVQPPGGGVPLSRVLPLDGATADFTLPIPDPRLWDIGQPNLYDVSLTLRAPDGSEDRVRTYFGMRKVQMREGRLWLNGRPVYLMTALDQGFWPDGLYTAPTDAALQADLQYARRIGLNGLRKHIKVEDPRFAYWADKLGLLLWCDTPSPAAFTPTADQRLVRDLQAMIQRDFNHPSIVVWSPYNESWGLEWRLGTNPEMQAWVSHLYDQVKAWDASRAVVDNSGWSHVKTDIADFHYYTDKVSEWRGITTILAEHPDEAMVLGHKLMAQGYSYSGEALMMSEYGAGWRDDRSWGLHWQTDELRRHDQISGYTYTELYDIEHEYAGYARYDRTPKDFGYDLAMINSPDYVVLDHQGSRTLRPGDRLALTPYVSAYGQPALTAGTLRWQLLRVAPTPEAAQVLAEGSVPASVQPYHVLRQPDLQLTVPPVQGPVQLWVTVADAAGTVRARNYLDFEVFSSPPARQEFSAGQIILRTNPGDHAGSHWDAAGLEAAPPLDGAREAVWGRDSGYVEYRLPLPAQAAGAWRDLRVRFEAGSRPAELWQSAAGNSHPSDLTVSLNGVDIAVSTLPGLPIDARGALSRLNGLGLPLYGTLLDLAVPADKLAAVRTAAQAEGYLRLRLEVKPDATHKGGLTLFGDRTGRYGIDPTLTLALAPTGLPRPALFSLAGLAVLAAGGLALRRRRRS